MNLYLIYKSRWRYFHEYQILSLRGTLEVFLLHTVKINILKLLQIDTEKINEIEIYILNIERKY
jgi:hypothetical protein